MVHWTQEATANFQRYLDQVATYAHHRGRSPEEAVQSIRSDIARMIQEQSIDVVDANVLYQLLKPERPPEKDVASQVLSTAKKTLGCAGCIVAVPLVFGGLCVLLFVFYMISYNQGHIKPELTPPPPPPPSSHASESEWRLRASCVENLKEVGLLFRYYANESNGELYPALSDEPGRLMFKIEQVYPEYLGDVTLLICPSDDYDSSDVSPVDIIDDHSYFYISHAIRNEVEGLAYVEAYRAATIAGEGFNHDFVTDDGSVIPRLTEDISEEASASEIPIMIERADHHTPSASRRNILFLDGHVEFRELDSGFPMTTEFLEALDSIDE